CQSSLPWGVWLSCAQRGMARDNSAAASAWRASHASPRSPSERARTLDQPGFARHDPLVSSSRSGVMGGQGRVARALAAACAATLFAAVGSGPATAASIFDLNFWLKGPQYDAVVPLCDTPSMLSKIQFRFAQKEGRFWKSDLTILGFERIREISFRPGGPGPPDAIPRRFSPGTALASEGKPRTIHYSISEDTGMIGVNWGVEWCVVGLDRNWAYTPACKQALP